jgi:SRSO17 transposase
VKRTGKRKKNQQVKERVRNMIEKGKEEGNIQMIMGRKRKNRKGKEEKK